MTDSKPLTAPAAHVSEARSEVEAVPQNWPDLLMALMHQQDLEGDQAAWAMDQIMSGKTPDVTMAAFLAAHHTKGETVEEIAGLVAAMMDHAVPLPGLEDSVDIVGTGGDRAKTANISSTAAMIISAAGQRVVKHGNRATSSASGSADVLEALGVRFDITPEQTGQIAHEVRCGLLLRQRLPSLDAVHRGCAPSDQRSHGVQHPRPADQPGTCSSHRDRSC